MKIRIFLFMLLVCRLAAAQTISGYVYDKAADLPLEGAYVYLDGTTISASTNSDGYFELHASQKYNAPLVVSYIGFQTMNVTDPFQYNKPLKILLKEDVISLKEVVITKGKGPFSRKEMLRAFRNQFLGTSKAGRSCIIENEDDIQLDYDVATNTLRAYAVKPLRIKNKNLQYDILFNLVDFNVGYRWKTLKPEYVNSSFFAGTTSFTDVSVGVKADKVRKEKHLGSQTHLMKTMAANAWKDQKFGLYANSFPVKPDRFFSITDTLDYKKITVKEMPQKSEIMIMEAAATPGGPRQKKEVVYQPPAKFSVLYNLEEQSELLFNENTIYIDRNGLFWPLTAVTFGGYISTLKAGDLLPVDYEIKE